MTGTPAGDAQVQMLFGHLLVLATAPAPGTIIPTMFSVAELWRKQQADNPELLTCSLGVMMFRCLLQEMNNRLCHALKTKEVLEALMKQDMLTDKQDWRYMIWDKDNGKLAPDTTRNPLSTKELQATLQEAANLLQNTPEMLTRFQLHPAPRTGDHQCHGPLPYRCHAQGQSTLSDSAQVVATRHLLNGRLKAGTGQAQSGRASGDGDAQSFVLSLRLRNDVNQCYANSLTLALTWTVLLHGGRTASPLQALFLRLNSQRAADHLTQIAGVANVCQWLAQAVTAA